MNYKTIRFTANIIEHLGSDLITSSEVAFIELIKNSLDASIRSNKKNVNISYFDNLSIVEKEHTLVEFDNNIIEFIPHEYRNKPLFLIEDLGCGMNEETIDKGFLAIGTDIKKETKNVHNEIMGEKGIGRLATQRLGKFLIVESASEDEKFSNIVAISWNDMVKSDDITKIEVPYKKGTKKADSYTRLWIFDVDETDLIRGDGQIELFKDYSKVMLNVELDNAVCFLVSPFKKQKNIPQISFYHNGHEIKYGFAVNMLNYAETVHKFIIDNSGENNELVLKFELDIRPWYVHRVHKSCIKPQTEFNKYEKNVEDYEDLLRKYIKKYETSFNYNVTKNDLIDFLVREEKKEFSITDKKDTEEITCFLRKRVQKEIEGLNDILPITGEIFSYKKDSNYCKTVIKFTEDKLTSAKGIQNFLKLYNGIKLYRGIYRIGFLGNKDNDWLKLQQYRTLGQQFYRFNLGTTLGEIVIRDPKQLFIREISSRLDIYRNETSNTFTKLLEKICNIYFYKFNSALSEMTKNILFDEGWLQGNIKQKLIIDSKKNEELTKHNKELIKKISKTKTILSQLTTDKNGDKVLSKVDYEDAVNTLDSTFNHIEKTSKYIESNRTLLEEARNGLQKIEIEAFNNYKLMANGLITETITHELHSIISKNYELNVDKYYNALTSYLWENNMQLYNNHLQPMKDTFDNVLDSLNKVSALYKILEGTFIKTNSSEEYTSENIENVIDSIRTRLVNELKKEKIEIKSNLSDMKWYMPRGVLLHVLYNLISNSRYWIDIRRKRSFIDKQYVEDGEDYIFIESVGYDGIIIYDTGTGVKADMEYVLFQPLQSGKGPDGRGMGLYIVKKLLNSFGGDIELQEDRNKYGNRYKFIVSVPEICL